MNKIALSIISVGFIVAIIIIFSSDSKINNTNIALNQETQNVEIKDGTQYITINARGGYFPKISNALADVPTKLIMKTESTYDCSSYLVINSLSYRNMLPSSGETVIDIGVPVTGKSLKGTCGMGMYGFVVNFK